MRDTMRRPAPRSKVRTAKIHTNDADFHVAGPASFLAQFACTIKLSTLSTPEQCGLAWAAVVVQWMAEWKCFTAASKLE